VTTSVFAATDRGRVAAIAVGLATATQTASAAGASADILLAKQFAGRPHGATFVKIRGRWIATLIERVTTAQTGTGVWLTGTLPAFLTATGIGLITNQSTSAFFGGARRFGRQTFGLTLALVIAKRFVRGTQIGVFLTTGLLLIAVAT